jgi:hypothetical protein
LNPRIQSTLREIRHILSRIEVVHPVFQKISENVSRYLQHVAKRPSRPAIWIVGAITAVVLVVMACVALPTAAVSGAAGSSHARSVGEDRAGVASAAQVGDRPQHSSASVRASEDNAPKRQSQPAAVKHSATPQHQAPAHHQAAVKHAAPQHAKAAPAPKHVAALKPYRIYDSVTPGSIPAGNAAAVYSTGSYAAQPADVAGHKTVLWIDTNGSNPDASVLDIEPGDATPTQAAAWAKQRLTKHPHDVARLYTMRSMWPSVQAAVNTLSSAMRAQIRYWIADPTGSDHMVPGADATQWYWGKSYDITTASPHF